MTAWQCFLQTGRQCFVNMACAPLFLVAVPLYALYYCWPYMAQLPDHIHCAIVDTDNSSLSRQLIMDLRSTPDLNVLQVSADRQEAILAMKTGEVSAIVEIPRNFASDVSNAIPTALTMTVNAAYLVGSKMTTSGVNGPLEAVANQSVSAWLANQGMSYSQLAKMKTQQPSLLIVPAYNTISGYLNFAVPIVFIIVFQTLMSAGTGMLFNAWYMQNPQPSILNAILSSPFSLFCAQMPIFLFCLFWSLFIEGPVFYLQGINSFQNIPATLVICAAFALAVSSFACFMAFVLGPTHFVMQGIVLSAIPCVFISGNLWPIQNMPAFFQMLAWLIPSTPGSQGIMRAAQCGASISEITTYLLHLLVLAIIYFLLARLAARWQLKHCQSRV